MGRKQKVKIAKFLIRDTRPRFGLPVNVLSLAHSDVAQACCESDAANPPVAHLGAQGGSRRARGGFWRSVTAPRMTAKGSDGDEA